eukprot:SAG22_NODE_166_length_16765_cov_30.782791_5_plen_190_part_00
MMYPVAAQDVVDSSRQAGGGCRRIERAGELCAASAGGLTVITGAGAGAAAAAAAAAACTAAVVLQVSDLGRLMSQPQRQFRTSAGNYICGQVQSYREGDAWCCGPQLLAFPRLRSRGAAAGAAASGSAAAAGAAGGGGDSSLADFRTRCPHLAELLEVRDRDFDVVRADDLLRRQKFSCQRCREENPCV